MHSVAGAISINLEVWIKFDVQEGVSWTAIFATGGKWDTALRHGSPRHKDQGGASAAQLAGVMLQLNEETSRTLDRKQNLGNRDADSFSAD